MVKNAKEPQRLISEMMIREMKMLIATDKVKNRTEVARRLHMSQNSIYRIEKSDKFSFTLQQFYFFCREFGISPSELFPK